MNFNLIVQFLFDGRAHVPHPSADGAGCIFSAAHTWI